MRDSKLKEHFSPTLYRELCLGRNATPQMIKQNYCKMIRNVHPDINPHNPYADDESKKLNFAYEVLSDTVLKARYDLLLDRHESEKAERARERERILQRMRGMAAAQQKANPSNKSELVLNIESFQNDMILNFVRRSVHLIKTLTK